MNNSTEKAAETVNVDPAELEKFSSLASRWWDTNGEFKALHEINPLRLNYIDSHVPVAGKRILDIGCGGGILSEGLAYRGATVTAIDMAGAALNVARLHLLESELDIDYQEATAEQFAEQHPQSFDVITCLEMLEHVPDPASVIKACARLVTPGGHLFFSTINRNPKSYLFAVLGAEYILQLLPKGTHDYTRFVKPSELAAAIRAAGLTLQDVTGMLYNPLTKRYRLGRDVDVNYLAYAVAL